MQLSLELQVSLASQVKGVRLPSNSFGCEVRDGQEPDSKSGRFPDKYVAPLACYRMLTRPRKKVKKLVNQ